MAVGEHRESIKLEICDKGDPSERLCHSFELYYVLEGELDVVTEGKRSSLGESDVCLVNADKMCSTHAKGKVLFALLSIDFRLMSDALQNTDAMYWCDSTQENARRYDELRELLNRLLERYVKTGGDLGDYTYVSIAYQVMALLTDKFLVLSASKAGAGGDGRFTERIGQINAYIRNNYQRQISLKDLSEKLYLSNGYLSRFFKQTYGMSFVDYLYDVRLYHAMDELLYTESPITTIAYNNGFPSSAVFGRVFKEHYGESPSSFRKRRTKPREGSREEPLDKSRIAGAERFLSTHTGHTGEQLSHYELSADVRTTKPLNRFWAHTINGCVASNLLETGMQEHALLLHRELGFEYLRLWNIFSKDMRIDIMSASGVRNYSRIDSVLDFLVQHHIKPHIELGPKPFLIVRSPDDDFVNSLEYISYPAPTVWRGIVDDFAHHIVARYGEQEVGAWRIELWLDEWRPSNEATIRSYLDLFEVTHDIFRAACPATSVGGCGFVLGRGMDHFSHLVDAWSQRKDILPDFFSVGFFPYKTHRSEEGTTRGTRIADDGLFRKRLTEARSMLEGTPLGEVPLFVTEWNGTVSRRNIINDACYRGAYVVKNALEVDGLVDDLAFFYGSDRESDYYDTDMPLFGGMGLISRDGIFKPSGFAFAFLSKLYQNVVWRDSRGIVTTDGRGRYGILCHNERPLSNRYYLESEDAIDPDEIASYFEDTDPTEVHLELTNVVPGTYRARIQKVNDQHGCAAGIWLEMGFESNLSRRDISYIRNTCQPQLVIKKFESNDTTLELDLRLEANEILYMELKKVR